MTNIDHLNVVATIYDMGSFQLASEKLNKARSAVSYSVKQVEDFYQVQNF
ncbi:MAG: LysR family transcriptional regulator [Shimia sp.]